MKTGRYMKMISHLFVAMMSVSLIACNSAKGNESAEVTGPVAISDSVEECTSKVIEEVAELTDVTGEAVTPELMEEEMISELTEEVIVSESVKEKVTAMEVTEEPVANPELPEEAVATPEPSEEPVFVATIGDEIIDEEPVLMPQVNQEEHVHNYVVTEVVEATCMEKGKEVSVCECGDIQTVTTHEGDHIYTLIEYTPPSCTKLGKTHFRCTQCGMSELTVTRKGHEYALAVRDSTCYATGTKTLYCTKCQAKLHTEDIPLKAHTLVEKIIDYPYHTVPGKKKIYCKVCGTHDHDEEIPPLDTHTFFQAQIGPCCVQTYCPCGYSSCDLISGSVEEMLGYINAERAYVGYGALTLDPEMNAAAQRRAEEIVTDYSHNGNDTGYAENINMALSVEDCFESWMSSSGHAANICGGGYTRMGFAWASGPDAVYFVALFD